MSRTANIRWRVQDERELLSVARDFNRKLDRLIEKNPKIASVLPQFYNPSTQQLESYVDINNLKSIIDSRKDYNRIINMLKRFLKEGAEEIVDAPTNEYGARTTKWHIQEMGRLVSTVNKKKKARLEDIKAIEMMNAEGDLGYTIGERFGMGTAARNQLNPSRAYTPSQNQSDINYKLGSLMRQSGTNYYNKKDAELKSNFIRELQRNYDRDDVKEVISAVKNMDNDLFVMKFEAHGDKMEQVYPPERGTPEYYANVEELKGYWLHTDAIELSPAITATLLNM